MALIVAALTAGGVTLGGGGDTFWVCVPAALVVASFGRSFKTSAIGGVLVVVAAAIPPLVDSGLHRLPAARLVVLIPAACLVTQLAMRHRLERERDELRQSALSDPLTGIANRRALLEKIDYEIARHARTNHSFALVMIDLDGFKALNDRFGHAAGDDLLRETAAALGHTIRAQDTAARIGGDEFCVLAPETEVDGIVQLEARIRRALGHVTTGVEALQASTGAAIFPGDGMAADALLATADFRLLAAKRERYRDRDYRRTPQAA